MSRAAALLLASVLLALLPIRAAGASPASPGDDEAHRHFERGQRHYNVGDFDAAIDEFKRAYELSPVPGLLFNIAQAYRAKKDRDRALYFYTTYLREDPDAPERAYVEARMGELQADAPEPAPPPTPTPSLLTPPPEEPRDTGRGLRLAGLITAAGGAALMGTAAVFAVRASSAADDVSVAFGAHAVWSPHLADLYADGRRDQTLTWIFGTVGVAAVATGGVLYYLGIREHHVGFAATSAGAAMTLQCAF